LDAVHDADLLPPGRAKPIRILGENYAIYRGQSGEVQVIDYRCPHRGAQMHLGWVEGDEIRCVYHGWKFNKGGQCTEQPAEHDGFHRKVKIGTYPTREHMGLIFAYFGEGVPPAFPPFPEPTGSRDSARSYRLPELSRNSVRLPGLYATDPTRYTLH
jgi:5,5'-dehydrodivanillate O-demethylase oxygenase subunit